MAVFSVSVLILRLLTLEEIILEAGKRMVSLIAVPEPALDLFNRSPYPFVESRHDRGTHKFDKPRDEIAAGCPGHIVFYATQAVRGIILKRSGPDAHSCVALGLFSEILRAERGFFAHGEP